ncbi:PilT/PilU family type 4a pilus ATPase [Suttonella sp. R2A3]|uniref:PilT/PilU family type 4a pilus ATPase n=1 Tax=Suttonella sp. R2A3 TaxID=2908648 RepID=UPI001F3A0BBC|nr:PilT/PilU family type 4a pilus ATPase [Suttonella sp. R2A3]UJF25032.1 PilT/PilU family type 4a pilus ATPase [Suttonella sp. R2A3]
MVIEQDKIRAIFEKIAATAVEREASDIFINAENHVAIKINGLMHYMKNLWFESKDVYNLLKTIVRPEAYEQYLKTNEMNVMVDIPNLSLFRLNAYMQRSKPGIVLRLIPSVIPKIEDLHLPGEQKIKDLAMLKRGLVIVCGATGTGKSTTLAAMIDRRNEQRRGHIITVEDPIEFMYQSKKSVVIQREIGIDTESFGTALKNSLRQAPNVILIGEIRDQETMEYAIHFAETGHLCLATLHATNAVHALDRIVNFFPRDQRKMLLEELATHLECILVQRLLPRSNQEGRIVAMEMMCLTPYIEKLIHEGELEKIHDAMERANIDDGVFTFDQCIFDLYEKDLISFEDAEMFVDSPNDFRVRVRNESERPMAQAMQSKMSFKIQSDESLEHEMLRRRLAERQRSQGK